MGDYDGATVLFDLDGVLVDSSESVRAGLTAWAWERGLDVDTVLADHHGRTDAGLVRLVAPHLDPVAEARRIEEHEAASGDGVRASPNRCGSPTWPPGPGSVSARRPGRSRRRRGSPRCATSSGCGWSGPST